MARKPIFQFFGIKINFGRIKSATKFRCVKTSSGKVVEQSISYEITDKFGRKVFASTWNIGWNWPTPLLHAVTILATAAPSATKWRHVYSKIECGQLHSELFGRRHSTQQSHGLFALAKHLSIAAVNRLNWALCVEESTKLSWVSQTTSFLAALCMLNYVSENTV